MWRGGGGRKTHKHNTPTTWKNTSDKLIIAYKIKLAAQVSQVVLFDLSLGEGLYNASAELQGK